MLDEERNVVAPFAQRRHKNREDVEAVEQILAKVAGSDFLIQVLVGGGDESHIRGDALGAAEPFELLFLDHAQNLGLGSRAHVADFIEKQRTVVGLLEFADAAGLSPGECSALVAEQLTFQQCLRNGGTIDR